MPIRVTATGVQTLNSGGGQRVTATGVQLLNSGGGQRVTATGLQVLYTPPEVSVKDAAALDSENIVIEGTVLNSESTLELDVNGVTYNPTSSEGSWSQTILAGELPAGAYTATITATSPESVVSQDTSTITISELGDPHPYWRLQFVDHNGGTFMAFAEAQLREEKYGRDVADGATITAGDTYTSGDPPEDLGDGSFHTDWKTTDQTTWVQFDLLSPGSVRTVAIGTSVGQTLSYTPKDFDVQWSEDGVNWVKEWEVRGATTWEEIEIKLFDSPAPVDNGVVSLSWTDNNPDETGHNVYRDISPMSTSALPAPLAVLGPDVTSYDDESLTLGSTYYYRVAAEQNGILAISDEVSLTLPDPVAGPPPRDTITISLVSDIHGTNTASEETQDALKRAGFLLSNVTTVVTGGTVPASDIVVIVDSSPASQTEAQPVLDAFAAGTPVLFGSEGATPFYADLIDEVLVQGANDYIDHDITDVSHPITDIFALGEIRVMHSGNYHWYVSDTATFVGQALAETDPSSSVPGKKILIAIDEGTLDINSNATPAKAVIWGGLYGDNSTYAIKGVNLLGKCIDWCMSP